VHQYREQLDRLGNLGHDTRDWQIPLDELKPLVYEADEYGNVLSQSDLVFIDRASFLSRVEPALRFAKLLLDRNLEEQERGRADAPEVEKAQREAILRLSRSRYHDNVIELMDSLLRFLHGVDERLDAIAFPERPRQQLRYWIQHIEEGRISAEDWSPLRNDLLDVFMHVRENLDDHEDFYQLPPIQQSLDAHEGYISSTMHDIEVLQGSSLQAGLDAFNSARQRSNALRPAKVAPDQSTATTGARKFAVFIGHGHSALWRELKDHIVDTLHLDAIYFEKSSRVGEHMKEILEGFADDTDCAILVLTKDDEQPDGPERARQNVVHEVGYFQGKHGFKRVAMLIQRGVEEFSNVAGIIAIQFDNHKIRGSFSDVDAWLRREGFIS
jgi:predicted nucleotide-binding protein